MSPNSDRCRRLSGSPTRRSLLATVAGGVAVGLAGCSGNGNGDGGGDGDEGNAPQSIIPGEVVHDGLEDIAVLEHWADERDYVMLRIRNEGNEPLSGSLDISRDERVIRGRALTEEGNVIGNGWWSASPTDEGPSSVNPGTEAEIGFLINADEGDRYELCLGIPEAIRESWEDMCG